ncbi:MAG: IS30 family transposase [Rhodococcus sp. (in: high G+C Gram-positive bacteria)]|uniref:IS30 family transposase n=1 Tax=Rhodococcus sp. TaxID=1831 RepID=UPI002AD8D6B2|nr:IS30 family transposase [Rhodococcus sp. (in: high G+C Gram-positive bacteria)]
MSAKRARFVELRSRGWSIGAAAREVGVSRSTGKNWHRGWKLYRDGVVVGFTPPLDRLAVRPISSRYLSQEERIAIGDLHRTGLSIRKIAEALGRAPSTISRELRRNQFPQGGYRPFDAHRQAVQRRARRHRRRVHRDIELREVIGELLATRWSPGQIARHLPQCFPDRPDRWLCHESIYRAVYEPGSALVRPLAVPPIAAPPLRSGRTHRRAHYRPHRRRPRFQQPMLGIGDRPFEPDDRSVAGAWEGDLIIGKNQGSAIGTLVERTTRTVRLLHLTSRDSDTLRAAIAARMSDLPPELFRSITWDQGIEMARHRSIAADLDIDVYFCDPHSPWQRGSNENMNGLLRQYFPKGTNLRIHTPEHLRAVEHELNNRPRVVLDDRTPAQLFDALIRSTNHRVLQR